MKSDLDWVEDFPHENGNYTNQCCHCKKEFIGHKRRVVCKMCDMNSDLVKEAEAHLKLKLHEDKVGAHMMRSLIGQLDAKDKEIKTWVTINGGNSAQNIALSLENKDLQAKVEQLEMSKDIMSGDFMTIEHDLKAEIKGLSRTVIELSGWIENSTCFDDEYDLAKVRAIANKFDKEA